MTVIRHSPQQALSTKTFLPMVCVPLTLTCCNKTYRKNLPAYGVCPVN